MAVDPGTWIIDLDGVIWLADEPISGAGEAISLLRRAGGRVVFATNNAAPTISQFLGRLARAGIDARPEDLVTSAQAAASMLDPGSSAFVCADEGVSEALEHRGVRNITGRSGDDIGGVVDAVIVGWTRRFDFEMLASAASLVRGGARFIGTNEDATHPTPHRLLPGSGALLAAVAVAAESEPEVAGKPHDPMVALVTHRAPDACRVVGDRPSTDGVLARRLGVAFAHIRSGVTSRDREPLAIQPDEEADDLLSLVRHIL